MASGATEDRACGTPAVRGSSGNVAAELVDDTGRSAGGGRRLGVLRVLERPTASGEVAPQGLGDELDT